MRPLYYTRLLLGAFFSVFSLGTASSAAVIPSDYSSRILPVSQVKAGMRGYGLTVFQGDKIDKFDVKVEGILPSVNSGRPLILIRVGGGQLNRRAINIAEGMSGSPVYIGGKLIGAVAYAGNFAVEPLGLVTPIEDMLEAWSTTLQAMPPGTGEVQPLPQPVKIGAKSMTSIGIASSPDQKAPSNDPSLGWFRPMATPLMASGLSPKTLAQAADKLSMFPISVRSGPGRMADKSVVFKEGSAVGFSLTTGDIEMTAVGTVTFVDKGRILAFGHPFLAMGPVQMPMSTVWVHDVFPSYEVSYKMASPVRVVGTSVQDRPFGVAGEVGRQSQMVPIAINLRDAASKTSHTFHVNVLNHPLLTPVLTRLAASEALQRFRPYPGEAMARVTMTATAKDVGTVQRTNLFFSPTDVTAEALDDVGNLLNLLQDNKFRPVPLTKLTVDVQIFQTRQTLDIERVAIDKTTYEPGQTVNITVQMRPYKSNPIVKTLQVKIPKDALDGRASVIVQGGGTVADTPAMPSSPGMPVMARPGIPEEIRDAGSLEQMLQRFSQLNRNDQLVARIQLPSASFSIEGGKLIGLPPSMENAILSPRTTPVRLARDEVKYTEDLPFFVNGIQALQFSIKARNLTEKVTTRPETPITLVDATTTTPTPSSASPRSILIVEEDSASVNTDHHQKRQTPSEPLDGSPAADTADATDTTTNAKQNDSAKDDSAKDDKSGVKPASKVSESPKLSDIGHSTRTWMQTTPEDFLKGRTDGTAVDSLGAVTLGKNLTQMAGFGDPFVWSVGLLPDGGIIAGSGNNGRVWKVLEGKAEILFSVPGPEVTAVACDPGGRIWAASSPDGDVWLYDNGQARKLLTLPVRHVGAVLMGPGAVYAGAGDGGTVWKLSDDGNYTVSSETDQKHVQCLAAGSDGRMYAGTAETGAVWRLGPGTAEAILKVNEEYISSIAVDKSGVVYASSGPRGKVYRVKPGEAPKVVIDKLTSQSAPLIIDIDGAALVVDGDTIYRVYADGRKLTQTMDSAPEIFTLCRGLGGNIIAGTANTGSVWTISPAASGVYESPVRDAERPAAWGKLTSVFDPSSAVKLQVRGGNTEAPDSTWSGWSNVQSDGTVGVRSRRYLQYRAELTAPEAGEARLEEFAVRYLPANQPPTVKISAPKAGAALSGKQTVSWTGTDPDSDKLTYVLSYSSDDGKTWNPIDKSTSPTTETKKEGVTSGKPASSKPTEKNDSTVKEPVSEIKQTEPLDPKLSAEDQELKKKLQEHPEIPDELKKQIMSSSDKFKRNFGANLDGKPVKTASSDSGDSTTSTSHSWDTSKIADGHYRLKLEASDRLANGPEALTATAEIGPIDIANSKPTVLIDRTATQAAGAAYQITGTATSKTVPIAAVQYKIDAKGEWALAQPDDGIYDDTTEPYTIQPQDLKPGKHNVEVQVKDTAGNSSITKKAIEITGKK